MYMFFYQFYRSFVMGYGVSVVVLKANYGMSVMGVKSRWGRDFP